ncbi:MAG TPA: molybdopterin cofactor-binding domain-containing protein, partial [Dehalococcoidia bacterium]|nr:molybdopterin cofactor-binding domain-containing protein [Dehalococcoidia bacterium]
DEDTAQEALEMIKVEYEPLPAIFDPVEAMKEGAPQLHAVDRNIAITVRHSVGDVDDGFRRSDYVREDTFSIQCVTHCALETHSCLASYENSGKLTLWASSQAIFPLRDDLALTLGLRLGDIRVIRPYVGGGFGGKVQMTGVEFCAPLLSMKAGRPVKVVNNREEEFIATRPRHPMTLRMKVGLKKDGTLMARECVNITDNGAYNSHGMVIVGRAGAQMSCLYRVPNFKYEGYLVYTNNLPGGAFRGFGHLQGRYADECQMDLVARDLGIDPVELRLKNAVQPGDVTPHLWQISSCALSECIQKVAERSGWWERDRKLQPGRGIGMAGGSYVAGLRLRHGTSAAFVSLHEDGSVTLLTGASDMGQGSDTLLSQIAAEELGVAFEDIKIISGDTGVTPVDAGAFASRTTIFAGNAVRRAAADAKRQLLEKAAEVLEANPADLEIRDRRIHVKGSPDRWMGFAEAVRSTLYAFGGNAILGRGEFDAKVAPHGRDFLLTSAGHISPAYTFGAQVIEVQVDGETGQVEPLKATVAQDCGYAINPMSLEGQVESCVAQAIGQALNEELTCREGVVLGPSFLDYKIATAFEMPVVETMLVESIEPAGPFGAKGMGEGTVVPTSPAIANAVQDAWGIRLKSLPITPEKVLKALQDETSGQPSQGLLPND